MPEKEAVYVVIRFGVSHIQRCRNSLWSKLSVTRSYNGSPLGIGEEVHVVEGNWPRHLRVALLEFESMKDARMWYEGTGDVKQPDWLDGVDIVAIPRRTDPDTSKTWFQIADITFTSAHEQFDEYAAKFSKVMKDAGASGGVCATDKLIKLRGLWDPGYVIISQFNDKEQHDKVEVTGGDELRKLRSQCASSKVVFFKLEPMKKPAAPANTVVVDYEKCLKD